MDHLRILLCPLHFSVRRCRTFVRYRLTRLRLDKYVIAAIYILVSSAGLAFSLPSSFNPNNYFGLGIGEITGQFQTDARTSVASSSAFFYDQRFNPQTSNTNLFGNVFIGKLFAWKRFLMGPEMALNLGAPNTKWTESASLLFPTETLTTMTQSQLNTVDGSFDARLGTFTNLGNFIYARLGVSVNKLSIDSNAVIARPLLPAEAVVVNSLSKVYAGLRAGAGFEQIVSQHFSIRGDYVFTYYSPVTVYNTSTQTSAIGVQLGPISNQTKIQINTQTVFLSLVYHWEEMYAGK